ncbi:uncharacterized protein LOC118409638 [Branchiostoma floridae]|uniref:Uncharacterized protein LOC118409638 n=1 Tax=Branchiostoma floridae TaxID=7739 RepID=C3ZA63_BRAFL|nr:uncharacterized protein LOC118409638 [Branchiostoma floridae]|eukprot:XP_002594640.1 hypothetical protein BRAFLDRAFT_77619 [Branchiostoma floridae]
MAELSRFVGSILFAVFLCPYVSAQTTYSPQPVQYDSAGIITACVVGGLLMLAVLIALLARLCKPCVSKEKKHQYDVRNQWDQEGAPPEPGYHVNRGYEPNIPNGTDIPVPQADYDRSIPRAHVQAPNYQTTIPRQDMYNGYVPEPSHAPMGAQPMIDIPAIETEDPRARYTPDPMDLYRYDQPHLGPDVNESDGWVTYQFNKRR